MTPVFPPFNQLHQSLALSGKGATCCMEGAPRGLAGGAERLEPPHGHFFL